MIDSVLFRIHNLEKHQHYVDWLQKYGVSGIQVDREELEMKSEEDEKDYWRKRRIFSKIFIDHGSGNRTKESYKNFIASHHYNIHYQINYLRDFIEFNLSIPKLLYGTNVFQFVNHFDTKKAWITSTRKLSDNMLQEDLYSRFHMFFDWFFDSLFGSKPDYAYVSFERIDFCFNQVFTNDYEALSYLGDIKTIGKKGLPKSSNSLSTYQGGWYLKGRNCTYKIYHKGTEFKKHDYKHIKKIYGADLANECQQFANKVLRYEVEVWSKGWNYYWSRYILGRKNIFWKKYRNLFLNLNRHGTVKRGDRVIDIRDLTRDEKRYIHRVKKVIGLKREFTLGGKIFNDDPMEVEIPERIKMSQRLFMRGFKKLTDFIQEFSLTSLSQVDDFVREIERPRDGARYAASLVKEDRFKSHIRQLGLDPDLYSWSKFKIISELLKSNSWDYIKNSKVIGRSTYFLYLKLFTVSFGNRSFQSQTVAKRSDLDSIRDYNYFFMSVRMRFKFRILNW